MPAAKGIKRAAAVEMGPAKRAHQDPAVEQSCGLILKALTAAPAPAALPEEVMQMLSKVLPLSVGVFQDQRHPYQTKMVDVVAELLGEIDTQIQTESEKAEEEVRNLDASKEVKASAVATAQEGLATKDSALQEQKLSLADATMAFRDLRDGLTQSRASEAEVDACLEATVAKLAATKAASQDLVEPLKESSLPEAESEDKLETLMSFLAKEIGLDESLLTALPAALGKAMDVRGPFDVLAVQELEHVMSERVAAISKEVEEGGPAKAERAAAVSAAQTSYNEAAGNLSTHAVAFRAAKSEQEQSAASVASEKKAVKDLGSARSRVSKQHDRALDKLSRFREGALGAFSELRDRRAQTNAEQEAAQAKEAGEEMEQPCPVDQDAPGGVEKSDVDVTAGCGEAGTALEDPGDAPMKEGALVADGQ